MTNGLSTTPTHLLNEPNPPRPCSPVDNLTMRHLILTTFFALATLSSGCEVAPADDPATAVDAQMSVQGEGLEEGRSLGMLQGVPEDSPFFQQVPEDSPFLLPPPDPRMLAAHAEWGGKTLGILGPAYGVQTSDMPLADKEANTRAAIAAIARIEEPYWRWSSTSSLAMGITEQLTESPEGIAPETFAFYARTLADVGNPNADLVSRAIDLAGPAFTPAERARVAEAALGAFEAARQRRAQRRAERGSRPMSPERAEMFHMMNRERPAITAGAERLRQLARGETRP